MRQFYQCFEMIDLRSSDLKTKIKQIHRIYCHLIQSAQDKFYILGLTFFTMTKEILIT